MWGTRQGHLHVHLFRLSRLALAPANPTPARYDSIACSANLSRSRPSPAKDLNTGTAVDGLKLAVKDSGALKIPLRGIRFPEAVPMWLTFLVAPLLTCTLRAVQVAWATYPMFGEWTCGGQP